MRPLNAFTVDLEEWYQGLTSTNPHVALWPSLGSRVVPASERLLAILRRHGVRATFFVLGYVADRNPALIERIHREGHEIGVRGYYHRFVSRLTPDEFARELELSVQAVERITGVRPRGHRAPYFSINSSTPWAFEVLAAQGFRYDSSVFPMRTTLYGFPGAPRFPHRPAGSTLVEFPISTFRLGGVNWPIAGGFYLRALPYQIVRWCLTQLNSQGQPGVFYVHPWELDLEQPAHPVTARERVTHFHGRRHLEQKLDCLLDEFSCGPLEAMLDQWNKVEAS